MKLAFENCRAEFVVSDATSFQAADVSLPQGLPLKSLKQVHGNEGVEMRISSPNFWLEGDFVWTFEPGLAVGVYVADCTAALIRGRQAGRNFVCALHAGWRGTADGIFENFLKILKPDSKPEMWLSPSISQDCYEVSDDVIEQLGKRAEKFYRKSRPGHGHLDLKGLQVDRLRKLGVEPIVSSLCTYSQPELFSYRKMQGKLDARHLAWISL